MTGRRPGRDFNVYRKPAQPMQQLTPPPPRLVPGRSVRKAPFIAAAALFAGAAGGADYEWRVVRVIDGDTVKVDASPDIPPELSSLSVRLRGVDTPEKGGRAKCDAERAAGLAATAFTEAAIARATLVVTRDPAWGKWGGRVIAELVLDGRSLAHDLIARGFGRAYDGSRRASWCP